MKINRKQFLAELQSVQSGLAPKEIIEQSSCFVFTGEDVMTFNDDIACTQTSQLKIKGAIKAKTLMSMLEKWVDEEIDVELVENELMIKGARRKAALIMEAEVLLPVDEIELPKNWKDLPPEFADAVHMVKSCAGEDPSNFALSCIHLHPEWMEACDNFQAARYLLDIPVKKPVLVKQEALKSIKGLNMLAVSETKNWIHFRNDTDLVLSCRRYLEDYHDITGLLEKKGTKIPLPDGLKEASEIASIFSSDNKDHNLITVRLKEGKMQLKGKGVSGWFTETRKTKYKGDPLSFAIDPKLLAELVDRFDKCQICKDPDLLKITFQGKYVFVSCLDA